MIKALVWKELRESAWIWLTAAAVCVVYLFEIMRIPLAPPPLNIILGQPSTQREIPFMGDQISRTYGYIGGVFGIAMGLWQSFGEHRRGTMPITWHLPISRRRIIAVKLAIGLSLVMGFTGVSLAVISIWAATPGTHPSPFAWSMTVATWRAWSALPLWYLGGFLTGMYPARWLGTRLFPLAASGVAFFFIISDQSILWRQSLWVFVPILLATEWFLVRAIVGLAVGAEGAKSGIVSRSRPALSLAFALVLAGQVVWACGVLWVHELTSFEVPSRDLNEAIVLRRDGTPLIRRFTEFRTLEGDPADVAELAESCWLSSSKTLVRWDYGRPAWASAYTIFPLGITFDPARRFHGDSWYLVEGDDGLGYFVAYDSETNAVVGYLDTHGFSKTMPPIERRFPISVLSLQGLSGHRTNSEPRSDSVGMRHHKFALGNSIYNIDFKLRTVKPFWSGADLVSYGILARPMGPETGAPRLREDNKWIVRTADKLDVLNLDGSPQYSVAIPQSFRESTLVVAEAPQGLVAVAEERHEGTVATLTPNAPPKIIRTPLVRSAAKPRRWEPYGLLAPGVFEFFEVLVGMGYVKGHACARTESWGVDTPLSTALAIEWPYFWPTLLAIIIFSAALAAWAWRWQRRYGLPGGAIWAGFVLVFGLPGLFAYLVHRSWPVRERCPACGALAPRDREACFQCGAEFPGPVVRSTDIRA